MIEGVKDVRKKLADGSVRYYYYLRFDPGSSFYQSDISINRMAKLPSDFLRAYAEATKSHEQADTYGALALEYLNSMRFKRLAEATQRDRRRLVEATLDIPLKGKNTARSAPLAVIDDRKVIPYLNAWRDSMASTPRQADLAISALSNVISFGQSLGKLDNNRARHLDRLYEAPIDEGSGWPEVDFRRFIGDGCLDVWRDAVMLMRLCGVRRQDAATIQWTAVKNDVLHFVTSKGRRKRREAIIPILPAGRQLLSELKEKQRERGVTATTILVNREGRPFTPSGLSSSIDKRRRKLGIIPSMHKLRNDYAGDLVVAHTKTPEVITRAIVCRAMGWSEQYLDKMIRIYVDDSRVIDAIQETLRTEGAQKNQQCGNRAETEAQTKKENGA
ncbi:MAG: tyrosine-type recombinase/integrase [Pseudomonadota bacterium]